MCVREKSVGDKVLTVYNNYIEAGYHQAVLVHR